MEIKKNGCRIEKAVLEWQTKSIKRWLAESCKIVLKGCDRYNAAGNGGGSGMKQKNRKALIITTVGGFVPQFEMNNLECIHCPGKAMLLPLKIIKKDKYSTCRFILLIQFILLCRCQTISPLIPAVFWSYYSIMKRRTQAGEKSLRLYWLGARKLHLE